MKKTLTRLFTVALLMMVSMGARAEVKVLFGENGAEKYEGKGGTIEVKQEESRDGGKVTVRLAFIPEKNYTFDEQSLEVYKVFSPESATARALEIDGDALKLEEDKSTNPSEKHYHVDIDSKLALWVKEAQFISESKADPTRSDDYSGTYFIANQNSKGTKYNASSPATNFYLVPAADPQLKNYQDAFYSSNYTESNGDPGKPFLTTALTNLDDNSAWKITKTNGYYTIQHVVTRKYIVYEPPHSDKPNRKSVHLLATDDPGEIGLFDIQQGSGGYTIRPLSVEGGNRYFNPANTNYNDYHGHDGDYNCAGLVGLYSDNKDNSLWHLESVPANNSYTFNVIDSQGNIAVKKTVDSQQSLSMLRDYNDIPEDIRSPYLAGETVTFYSFDGDYSSDKLTDENIITATPYANNSNIYVIYTLDHLSEKFLRLRGARAFNIVTNDSYAYDNNGTLAYDNNAANKTQSNYLWNISGGDPYAVQIENLGTHRFLVSSSMPTLSLAGNATKFILMEESASATAENEQVKLMKATGTEDLVVEKAVFQANPVSITTKYHLIDKARKLIQGNIECESSELGLPEEWRSPLVSEYHYFKTSGLSGDTYTPSDPISNLLEVGDGGDIYVTYDVSSDIDLTGGKSYLLKFSDGVSFNQENGSDGINTTSTKAIYPYNNGDFNLYVYGQEQWLEQLANGASTRTRWLWKFVSRHGGTDLTGDQVDPYHVVVKSHQNHTIKATKGSDTEYKYPGNSYLQTYKPSDYAGVITNIAYENKEYNQYYPNVMSTPMVNGAPTEYMILGTSLQDMKLKTFSAVDDQRRIVNSFEQYWKNNPTVANLSQVPTDWHQYTSWAYSAPVGNDNKRLKEENHWYQTISMGTGEFSVEEVSLTPQVILLDQHGWEVVRVPMYTDNDFTVVNTEALHKYNSPMVSEYHWYPSANKVTGYHKYNISDPAPKIDIYENSANPNNNNKVEWHVVRNDSYSSNSLAMTPDGNLDGYAGQDKKYKSDFYVTYTVKPEYANSYTGAATAAATVASAVRIKQDGKYASTDGSQITPIEAADNQETIPDEMQWYLRPNFNIDREMGYRYAGESGAYEGAKSQSETETENFANGKNGFDPYNIQIQSKKYPQRYFTTNTSAPALANGVWTGNSSSISLQNMTTTSRQTATGYDQTTLLITNATFMVVDDGHGNMRLMPRFDHSTVMQSFTTLAEQNTEADASQTLLLGQAPRLIHSSSEMTSLNGRYILASDFTFASNYESLGTSTKPFTGTIDGQFNTLTGLTEPLVAYAQDAIIKNVILKDVKISQAGYVGAIACTANGTTRIYNCGILPTTADHPNDETRSTVESTNNDCGSLVGYLDGYARVINCFSYANVKAPAGNNKIAGGLVGRNTIGTKQGNSETDFNNNCKTMVVNCMFYGDITQGNIKRPVYGGTVIANNPENTVNNYNYFCEEEVSFEASLDNISKYFNTWPVAKKYFTRFDVYRNILNSNRRLCTWWVNGVYNTAPSDANVESVGIAKWVLDLSIAPYPILKKWGKYSSVINKNPDQRVNPSTKAWENRGDASSHWGKNMAPDTEGQILGSIAVSIDAGSHHTGSDSRTINITAMDTEYKDYCYGKIQLPYYNEIFGNPNGSTWSEKYGDNYGEYVVTGWEITSTNGSDADGHSFSADWQNGYNFADRKCVSKDIYETSGRVFAQGGYYYVPEGVTTITIKAHWGKAVYLCNKNYRLDMINNAGNEFYIAGALSFGSTSGILPLWPSDNTLKTSLDDAINGLSVNPTGSVYDQAIVLVGNYQNGEIQGGGANNTGKLILNGSNYNTNAKPFTIMSADFDFDNEPDFCFQAGMFNGGRPNVQPIRFDFLMVPDITMVIRKDNTYLGMRIFCPQGHFEVTETSYMYITQFEYDKRGTTTHNKHEAPLILNGGEFMQIVSTENQDNTPVDRTSYILMGGNLFMKAFTPGTHGNRTTKTRHCAVNAIGGEFPEFYLSGMFRSDFYNNTDNPHAYLDGGKFGIVAGAGMESVGAQNETNGGDVTFKINHSWIREFYGGGINANKPVTGNIEVTIDNSIVHKYCGGPKLGDMSNAKTIKTYATGTTFDEFYGGGNGGTNLLRERKSDAGAGVGAPTKDNHTIWDRASTGNGQGDNYGGFFTAFTPFSYTSGKGYQAEYEFEMLPRTSGNVQVITRSYYYWASFSKTTVAPVTNTITDCTFNGNFYGGGNLGAVDSPTSSANPAISSTISGHTVVHGSVFGAGYSASATSFKVHDKSTVVYPYRDNAGFIHDGSLDYEKISVEPLVYKEYTWIHDIPASWGKTASTSSPTFDYDGNSYCYTTVELTGLGTVTGNVSLTIEGTTEIDEDVYGGGDASAVDGSTAVILQGDATVTGNVFGGGNSGEVTGSATVTIRKTPANNNGTGSGTDEESGGGQGN